MDELLQQIEELKSQVELLRDELRLLQYNHEELNESVNRLYNPDN